MPDRTASTMTMCLAAIRCALLVEWNRRLATRRHDEDVFVVEPVEDPEVVPGDAPHMSAAGREAGLAISSAGERAGFHGAERCEHRAVLPGARAHAEAIEASTERRAQPRDSSGHGDSPVRMQRSSCSVVSSM